MNGFGIYPMTTTPEDLLVNLLKDGGRTVMHGGDPYEDDLEPDEPAPRSGPFGNPDCRPNPR